MATTFFTVTLARQDNGKFLMDYEYDGTKLDSTNGPRCLEIAARLKAVSWAALKDLDDEIIEMCACPLQEVDLAQ